MSLARLACLLLFVAVAAMVGLGVGSTSVGFGDVARAFTQGHVDTPTGIVLDLRLPRMLLGLGVGAALALAGVLLQSLFQNDLAEPYLLGVGPGAFLGVTLAAVFFGAAGAGTMPSALHRGLGAFLGAAGVTALVFAFARQRGRGSVATVLLAGVAVGAFVSAIATGLLHGAVRDWAQVLRWMLGDLELASVGEAAGMAGVVVFAMALALWRARDLDALALGERTAALGGVPIRGALWVGGGLACLLAGTAVALCGQVGFVGLVVPHLARGMFGATHRVLLPAAALLGGGLLVLADAVAQALNAPEGLPLGVVTALLGAPVLVVLLLRRG